MPLLAPAQHVELQLLLDDLQWLPLADAPALLADVLRVLPAVAPREHLRALLLALPSVFEERLHTRLARGLLAPALADRLPLVLEALAPLPLPPAVGDDLLGAALGALARTALDDVPAVLRFVAAKTTPANAPRVCALLRAGLALDALWRPVALVAQKGKRRAAAAPRFISALRDLAEGIRIASSSNPLFAKAYLDTLTGLEHSSSASASSSGGGGGSKDGGGENRTWTLLDAVMLFFFARDAKFRPTIIRLLRTHYNNNKEEDINNSSNDGSRGNAKEQEEYEEEGERITAATTTATDKLMIRAIKVLSLQGLLESVGELPRELDELFEPAAEVAAGLVCECVPLGATLYTALLECYGDREHVKRLLDRLNGHFSSSRPQEVSMVLAVLTAAAERVPAFAAHARDQLKSTLEHFDKFTDDNVRQLYTLYATLCYTRKGSGDDGGENNDDDDNGADGCDEENNPMRVTKNEAFFIDSSGVNIKNLLTKQLASPDPRRRRAGAIGTAALVRRTRTLADDSTDFLQSALRLTRTAPAARAVLYDELCRALQPPLHPALLSKLDHALQEEFKTTFDGPFPLDTASGSASGAGSGSGSGSGSSTPGGDDVVWFDLGSSDEHAQAVAIYSCAAQAPADLGTGSSAGSQRQLQLRQRRGRRRRAPIAALCPLLCALARVAVLRSGSVQTVNMFLTRPLEMFARAQAPADAREAEDRTAALFAAACWLRELLNVFHAEPALRAAVRQRLRHLLCVEDLYRLQHARAPCARVTPPSRPLPASYALPEDPAAAGAPPPPDQRYSVLALEHRHRVGFFSAAGAAGAGGAASSGGTALDGEADGPPAQLRPLHPGTVYHLLGVLEEADGEDTKDGAERARERAFLLYELSEPTRLDAVARVTKPAQAHCLAGVLAHAISMLRADALNDALDTPPPSPAAAAAAAAGGGAGAGAGALDDATRTATVESAYSALRLVQQLITVHSAPSERRTWAAALLPDRSRRSSGAPDDENAAVRALFEAYRGLLAGGCGDDLGVAAGLVEVLAMVAQWHTPVLAREVSAACAGVLARAWPASAVAARQRRHDECLKRLVQMRIDAAPNALEEIATLAQLFHARAMRGGRGGSGNDGNEDETEEQEQEEEDDGSCKSLDEEGMGPYFWALLDAVAAQMPAKEHAGAADALEACMDCFAAYNTLLDATKSARWRLKEATLVDALQLSVRILAKARALVARCLVPAYRSAAQRERVAAGIRQFQKGYRQLTSVCDHAEQRHMRRAARFLPKVKEGVEAFVQELKAQLPDLLKVATLRLRDLHGAARARSEMLSQALPSQRRRCDSSQSQAQGRSQRQSQSQKRPRPSAPAPAPAPAPPAVHHEPVHDEPVHDEPEIDLLDDPEPQPPLPQTTITPGDPGGLFTAPSEHDDDIPMDDDADEIDIELSTPFRKQRQEEEKVSSLRHEPAQEDLEDDIINPP